MVKFILFVLFVLFVAFGIEAEIVKVHKLLYDDNKTVACLQLKHLAGWLELVADGQNKNAGAYAKDYCILLDTTHLIVMTGEYIYEHEYRDDITVPLVKAEIYVDEYLGDYWIQKDYFDHPKYTASMEKEIERSPIVKSGEKLLAAEEAAPLIQEQEESKRKEAEAARAAHVAKYGEWEHTVDFLLGDIIYVHNVSSESKYDTWLQLTYTCDGKLLLSGETLSTQRIRMRFDNEELVRRWREHSWEPGAIQLQRVPNPALRGDELVLRLTYSYQTLFEKGEITDRAVFPIARWSESVDKYCH